MSQLITVLPSTTVVGLPSTTLSETAISHHATSNQTSAIAMDVSVPIGVIAMISLIIMFFRERNRRKRAKTGDQIRDQQPNLPKGRDEAFGALSPQKLCGTYRRTPKLGWRNIHEAGEQSHRHRVPQAESPSVHDVARSTCAARHIPFEDLTEQNHQSTIRQNKSGWESQRGAGREESYMCLDIV